jgi:hypothetical protein
VVVVQVLSKIQGTWKWILVRFLPSLSVRAEPAGFRVILRGLQENLEPLPRLRAVTEKLSSPEPPMAEKEVTELSRITVELGALGERRRETAVQGELVLLERVARKARTALTRPTLATEGKVAVRIWILEDQVVVAAVRSVMEAWEEMLNEVLRILTRAVGLARGPAVEEEREVIMLMEPLVGKAATAKLLSFPANND